MSEQKRLTFLNAIFADWEMVYSETDMQNAFSLFHTKLVELYHKYFPKRLGFLMHLKKEYEMNKLYLKYDRRKSVANDIKHKTYHNKLNRILKFARSKKIFFWPDWWKKAQHLEDLTD